MANLSTKAGQPARRLAGRVAGLLKLATGILLFAMVLLNGANAIGRYVFHRAINGADEILVYAMVWMVFLGAAVVTWQERHLCIELIQAQFSLTWQAVLRVVQLLSLIGLCGLVVMQSIEVIMSLGRIGQRSMAAEIPMTVPHAAIAMGLGLAVLFGAIRLFWPAGADDEAKGGPAP